MLKFNFWILRLICTIWKSRRIEVQSHYFPFPPTGQGLASSDIFKRFGFGNL